MKITKLKIHNYRSICELEISCEPLVVLLGANNSGKSNILNALEFCLSTSIKPSESDFCQFLNSDKCMYVELTFNQLTDQEKITFKKYLLEDESICIRRTAEIKENNLVETSYNGYTYEPEDDWLKRDNSQIFTNREELNKTPLKEYVPTSGRITKNDIEEVQFKYIEDHKFELKFFRTLESVSLLGQKNVAGGILPDFFIIPAVRDLTDETKIKTTTVFGRLLNQAVKEMAEKDGKFKAIKEDLITLIKSLNRSEDQSEGRPKQLFDLESAIQNELAQWDVDVEIEVIPPEIEKFFELGTNLHLDDGVKTLAENKGHGLQRAVIFALIRVWSNILHMKKPQENEEIKKRVSSDSIIFAIEEPELFLHPHAQRKLFLDLKELSLDPDHQIFICSHSPHFIDLEKYKSICVVTKNGSSGISMGKGLIHHNEREWQSGNCESSGIPERLI